MNFNLDPLTPTTFMKQARTKMDGGIEKLRRDCIKK